MEKYEEFITWSTYSGILAGGLHSVIQDWRVLKIVKKIKKNFLKCSEICNMHV